MDSDTDARAVRRALEVCDLLADCFTDKPIVVATFERVHRAPQAPSRGVVTLQVLADAVLVIAAVRGATRVLGSARYPFPRLPGDPSRTDVDAIGGPLFRADLAAALALGLRLLAGREQAAA